MNNKKKIAIIFGGNNFEHKVSLKTGYSISKELTKYNKFNLLFIGIDTNNKWYYNKKIDNIIFNHSNINNIKINKQNSEIFQIGSGKINNEKIDCVFLATHGKYVEDGNLQGFLKTNNLVYTGSHIEGSVIAMNKHLSKMIARENNIDVIEDVCLQSSYIDTILENKIKDLGENLVIKINSGGSSEGVFFTNFKNKIDEINKAFLLDDIVLIEKKIECRELSIGIIESKNNLLISDIGEYGKTDNYFSFDEKYKCSNKNIVPANISSEIQKKIIMIARNLFKKLCLKNYARIDFFLTYDNKLYFNEVNSLPGFYNKSLFCQLWTDYQYIDIILLIINNAFFSK